MQLLRKSPVNWSPCLLILIAVLGGRIRRSNGHNRNIETLFEGEEVSFTCDDRAKEFIDEVAWWKMDFPSMTSRELLAKDQKMVTKDERFSIHENATELRIVNLTMDDTATYQCLIKPRGILQYWRMNILWVKVDDTKVCKAPDVPLNGGFKAVNKRDDDKDPYRFGEKIRYRCNKGYVLEGEALRTCVGPTGNWTGEAPSCETKFAIGTRRLLEEAMVSLKLLKEEVMVSLERKVSAVEERLAALEAGLTTNVSSATDSSYGPLFLKGSPPPQPGGGQPVSGQLPPPPQLPPL